MSEAFLSQLLRVENVSIQPGSTERCVICLEDCGDKTGGVEWAVRLPCSHTFGSRCIATWLDPAGAANNSCPLCRKELFPAQPRPWLEDEVVEVDPFAWAGWPDYLADSEDGRFEGYELYSESDDPEPLLHANGPVFEEEEEIEEEESEEEFPIREHARPDPSNLETIKIMCETYSLRLNLPPYFSVTAISQSLARNYISTT